MCLVPSVEPRSAQTTSSGSCPCPMIRCSTVPKARPAFRVGMTIEVESPASPIWACNGRWRRFRPRRLGEPDSDEVEVLLSCGVHHLDLPPRSRDGAGEADAHVVMPK